MPEVDSCYMFCHMIKENKINHRSFADRSILKLETLCKIKTRSTADAVERPSPVNLLRAAVTGIGENTQM